MNLTETLTKWRIYWHGSVPQIIVDGPVHGLEWPTPIRHTACAILEAAAAGQLHSYGPPAQGRDIILTPKQIRSHRRIGRNREPARVAWIEYDALLDSHEELRRMAWETNAIKEAWDELTTLDKRGR